MASLSRFTQRLALTRPSQTVRSPISVLRAYLSSHVRHSHYAPSHSIQSGRRLTLSRYTDRSTTIAHPLWLNLGQRRLLHGSKPEPNREAHAKATPPEPPKQVESHAGVVDTLGHGLRAGSLFFFGYLYLSENQKRRDQLADVNIRVLLLELKDNTIISQLLKFEHRRMAAMIQCEELGVDHSIEEVDENLDESGREVCCPCCQKLIDAMLQAYLEEDDFEESPHVEGGD